MECSHSKSLFTSSSVWRYQVSLSTSTYQGRRLWCNPFSLVDRQVVWARAVTIHLGSNTYRPSWRLKGEISNRSWENTEKLVRRRCHFGGNNIPEVKQLKATMTRIFTEANFELHKWHSKIKELEGYDGNDGLVYAKSRLGVTFSYLNVEPTKRVILQKLASCYNPAGLATFILLIGK